MMATAPRAIKNTERFKYAPTIVPTREGSERVWREGDTRKKMANEQEQPTLERVCMGFVNDSDVVEHHPDCDLPQYSTKPRATHGLSEACYMMSKFLLRQRHSDTKSFEQKLRDAGYKGEVMP
jgi:hypothetical protein